MAALVYNYFRTLDPSTGRYLESDPIGLAAGLNTYSYVSNMPTMRTDRYGLIEWNGTYVQYNVGFFAEVSRYWFVLYSECVDGERVSVRLGATAIGGGLSWPFGSSTGAEVTLNDPYDQIYVGELAGPFAHISSGFVIGGGVTAGAMSVGAAEGQGSVTATGGAIDSNIATLVLGRSWIIPDSVIRQKCEQSCGE